MKNTKDQISFTTICVVFTALFVNVWALVCAAACFATWKVLESSEKAKQDRKQNVSAGEKSTKEDPVNAPEKEDEKPDFMSQKDIDSLLNGDEEDPFIVRSES